MGAATDTCFPLFDALDLLPWESRAAAGVQVWLRLIAAWPTRRRDLLLRGLAGGGRDHQKRGYILQREGTSRINNDLCVKCVEFRLEIGIPGRQRGHSGR